MATSGVNEDMHRFLSARCYASEEESLARDLAVD